MRFHPAIAAAASVVVAACTPMQWVKQDATPEQLQEDSIHCQQEAWREARTRSWYYRPIAPILGASGRHFAWPYGPYGDPFGDPYIEEARLSQFCMRSKGYEMQPVEKPKEQVEPKK